MSQRSTPPGSASPLAPAFVSLLQPLLLRPLLWLCCAALVGVAFGGVCARAWFDMAREEAPLWLFVPLLVAGVGASWMFRRNPWLLRLGLALVVAAFFALHTTRRLLLPRDDISRQAVLAQSSRDQPLRAPLVRIVGLIGDYPKHSRWNLRFPLDVERADGRNQKGRIWMSVPYDRRLEVGDRLEVVTELRPLRYAPNPGEQEAFWAQIGARCWCENGPIVELSVLKPGAGFPLERRVQGVRRALLHRYETLFGGDEETLYNRPFPLANAALLTAMVWGENGLPQPLPEQTRTDFRAAGLSHLLVASGSQCAVVVVILLYLARLLRARRAWILILVVPALTAYVMVVGATPSIWRAAACGLLGTLCLVCGRDLDGLSLWSAALLGLLLLDPALAWNLSLQLTFAAVWGLIVVAPLIFHAIKRLNAGVAGQLVSMSLGAQAATWPLSVLHFGTASMVGLGANFLAVPLAGILVVVGAVGLIVPWAGPIYFLTDAVHSIAASASRLEGAQLEGLSWSNAQSLACYAVLVFATFPLADEWGELRSGFAEKMKHWRASLSLWEPKYVCAGLGVVCLAVGVRTLWPSSQMLRVTMLDVGQGQCVLIQDPSGHAALVDGGSLDGKERADIGASVIVPALQNLGVDRLDYVFLTSPEEDHCNGLRRVLHEIPVGAFVDGPRAAQRRGTELWDELGQAELLNLRRDIEQEKVSVIVPNAGDEFSIGDTKLRVLGPLLPLSASQNDNSLVLKVEWKNRSVLLAGDLETAGEKTLVQRVSSLKCDVLQLARHGSSSSSTPEFLRATSPGAALISCGRFNRLGVPSPSVLHQMSARQIPLFRTDLDGALSVECDEEACRITPQNP